jgi:hypothetical protein
MVSGGFVKQLRLLPAAIALIACGSNGSDGAAGTNGTPGDPGPTGTITTSLNQVLPRFGLIGRKTSVHLAFDGQKLAAPPGKGDVKFGDLTVTKVTPEGNGIVVDLDIPDTHSLGPVDITIGQVTAKGAFVVAAPLDVKVGAGKAEQGGLVRLDISNLDRTYFDTQNFVLEQQGVTAATGSLLMLSSTGLTATDGSIFMIGDPLMKTGAAGFIGTNNPQDPQSATFLSAQDAITVGDRSPEAVTANTPVQKTLDQPLANAFFTATPTPAASEGLLVDAHAVTPAGSTIKPFVAGYGASGHASDLIDVKQDDPGFPGLIPPTEARVAYPLTTAQKAFFVVVDHSFANSASTKLTFDYQTYRASLVAEQGTAHDVTPQNLGALPLLADAIPGMIIQGELTTATELDTYSFTGLAAGTVIDLTVSMTADSPNISALVDTVATFDSPDLVQVQMGGKAGSGSTSAVKGASRFLQVGGAKGKYQLGIRRAQ